MKKEIYFVTGNSEKFQEIKYFLNKIAPKVEIKPFNTDIVEIQTLDQKELIIDKALKAWEMLKKPLIVDDTAIYFEKYNKFPGIMTKYIFEGIGIKGITKLFDNGDKAHFLLYIAYIDSPQNIKLFQGQTKGTLIEPKNFNINPKLPYNYIFIPNGTTKTNEEIRNTPIYEKYSHRAKALKSFITWYKNK